MYSRKMLALLKKRHESSETYSGFLAGITLGILMAIFVFAVLIIYKEKAIQDISAALEIFGERAPFGTMQLYYVTLYMTPIVIVLVYAIVGIFFGVFVQKNKWKMSSNKIILLCIVIGIINGLILNTPANKLMESIAGTIGWIVFSMVFLFLSKKKSL